MVRTQKARLIGDHVGHTVATLQSGYIVKRPVSVRRMAALRGTSLSRLPGPEMWEVLYEGLPEDLQGRDDQPSRAESAVQWALTLYSIHQQGKRTPMHDPAVSFGSAVRRLALVRGDGGQMAPSVITRFHQAVASEHMSVRLVHLRTLITLLRAEEIPVSYSQLAQDLYALQRPQSAANTTLRWGRDLHRSRQSDPQPNLAAGGQPASPRLSSTDIQEKQS